MTNRLLLLATAVTFAAAAPSRSVLAQSSSEKPPAPQAPATKDVDPVGTYELSVVVQGTAMPSTIKIEKKPDATLGGTVTTDAYGVFPIGAVKVSGKTITIGLSTQDGSPVTITLTLEGDQVAGEWSMANDGSKVTGKKLPPV
jgi:hypothetical protein